MNKNSAFLSVFTISVLFFFSGLSALIYEVTWLRKLSLIFGTDTYAVSTVIAVFFTGLAIGSYLFGKLVDQRRYTLNPLFLYGLLELGIGLYAAGTPWIFKGIEAIQIAIWRNLDPSFGYFSLWTLALSVIGLIVPTVLMGGTLPVISQWLMRINTNEKERMDEKEKIGNSVGSLYGVNTAGAVLGVLAAGFWLIARLGVNETIWMAAGISVMVGVIAVWMSRMSTDDIRISTDNQRSSALNWHSSALLAAYGLAGFAAISLEVLWTRMLVIIVGGSVYAFSLVLISFLIGISLGSLVVAKVSDRIRYPLIWFGVVQILIGSFVILLIPAFGNLPFWYLSIFESFGDSFANLQFGIFLIAIAVMTIPTLLMGGAFPLVVKAYKEHGLGERVGRVYASNTVGGVIGALIAGFIFLPSLGVQKAILLSAFIYLATGTLVLVQAKVERIYKYLSLGLVVLILFWGLRQQSWNKNLLTAGFYVDPSVYSRQDRSDILNILSRDEILYDKDGISAHVAVRRERNGNINLRINGKADASTSADMENQLLLGHLPLLLHENPKEVLVIGMGSGITLGSVLSHPVFNVDAIEIEKRVVEAAEFFSEYSNNALSDPRANIIIADGRYFLAATDKKYDVISSEPSNPWLTGSSKLFTKEYFELLKRAIKDDGIVAHWINLYSLDIEGLKAVLASFYEVFDYVSVFGIPSSNDLILVGSESKEQITFDFTRMIERLGYEKTAANLAIIGVKNPYEVLSYFILDDTSAKKLSSGAQKNTDNNPYVEFSAPKYLYTPVVKNPWHILAENLSAIADTVKNEPDDAGVRIKKAEEFREARILTHVAFIERNIGDGINYGEKAVSFDTENPFLYEILARLYFEEGSSFLNRGEYASAVKSFERSADLKQTSETYVNLGLSYEGQGDLEKAKQAYNGAIGLDEGFETAHLELARVLGELGDFNAAIEAYTKVTELDPENTEALVSLGQLYILRKNFGRAEEYLNKALNVDPKLKEAKDLLRKIP